MTGKFNINILVAPLDWGLGHATRCIPIIQYLTLKGCNVIIATEGTQKELLTKEFPHLKILPLKGYRIRYSKNKRFFALKILQQVPQIIRSIWHEHQWLKAIVNNERIDVVISDNRYGLYNNNICSIIVTHQLEIKIPIPALQKVIQFLNYQFINRFEQCWIPDFDGNENLAGSLAHSRKLPKVTLRYLGGLSRLNIEANLKYEYKFLAVISGPEPQRSYFEQHLFNDLQHFNGTGLIVRGLPANDDVIDDFGNVHVVNHLNAIEMQEAFNKSEYVISRSGYTTVMDLIKLSKKSILVPTPAQTEQQYLANHLHKLKWAFTMDQANFKLSNALAHAECFEYGLPTLNFDLYKNVIDDFIDNFKK